MAHQSPQSNPEVWLFKTPYNLTTVVPRATLHRQTYSVASFPSRHLSHNLQLSVHALCVCLCCASKKSKRKVEKKQTVECPATGGKPREELKKKHVMMTPGLSASGTLHLNDITQTHRQNNTSAVKYKQDRLSDASNRQADDGPSAMTDRC